MLIQLLTGIHNLTTMLFGIFISAFFLGVRQNAKNTGILLLFSVCDGTCYLISLLTFGETLSNQLYPFLVHLPLALFLILYYHYPVISAFVSVFSAYLCCQISNWVGLLLLDLTGREWCYYVARITTTVLTFLILCKYVCRTTTAVFAKEKHALCIIGFLPFIYYIFDYAVTKFSLLLYSGNKAIVEFMGFAFCIAYLIFLLIYFQEYEQKQEIRQYSNLMEIQLSSVQKGIEQMNASKQTMSILRHDTRHHLSVLRSFLQNDHVDKALLYIQSIDEAYDETVMTIYSKNEMINSILSIYDDRFRNDGISLCCDISVPETLPCPEIAFCAILSNALENAMHALSEIDTPRKWASLSISNKGSHLLLRLENPVDKVPTFVDGIPVSTKEGHGIGSKSIVYYVEQLNGQCHFSAANGMFVMRVII